MSLALVVVESTQFDEIYQHLCTHMPKYQNMHMREACQRDGKRDLRYLHAMHATSGPGQQIDGMISGPGVFWHYRMLRVRQRPQVRILTEQADRKAIVRMGKRFLREILDRVYDEQNVPPSPYVTRSPGQYYLRRKIGGMSSSHPNCITAVRSGVLSQPFVSQLESWNFELLHP